MGHDGGRRRTAARLLVVALLSVLAPLAPVGPETAAQAANGTCTIGRAGDGCTMGQYDMTVTSVTMSVTAHSTYSLCTGGQVSGCLYQFHAEASSTGYNSPPAGSATCDGTALPHGGGWYLATGTSTSCTFTYTWTHADGSAYPVGLFINIIEADGAAITLSGGSHSFNTFRDRPAPVASFTVKKSTTKPLEYTFTSTSTSRLGGMFHRWDFGDGSLATGPVVTHTYAAPGVYTVGLRVTDQGPHESTAAQQVQITPGTASATTLAVHLSSSPPTDPGTFDLVVDGKTILSGGRHDGVAAVTVTAGTHAVAEVATGVAQTFYDVDLTCQDQAGATVLRTRAVSGVVTVREGTRVDCTFTNTRTTKKHCVVPDVLGEKLKKATKAIKKANCTLGKVVERGEGKRVVTKVKPVPGSVRGDDAKVKLTLQPF